MTKDTECPEDILLEEILEGLSQNQKQLPSKYFYDETGSKLFDEICELDEYYPTRTEQKIMNDNIEDICTNLNEDTLFIEFGSGSSTKTQLILSHVKALEAYVPIDISEEHLKSTSEFLREKYPSLKVSPVAADYTQPFDLPEELKFIKEKVAYFPGSTLGNFTPAEAKNFLLSVSKLVGEGGYLLLGIDLIKEVHVLNDAYNDKKGITAAFNLNMLKRLNKEYDASINLENFKHYAYYNVTHSRIEMHLVSNVDQEFSVGGKIINMGRGETIRTEYSYKYSIGGIKYLIQDFFETEKLWTDANKYFGVLLLKAI